MPDPDDDDHEDVRFFSENDPIVTDSQAIKSFVGSGDPPDVVLQGLRVFGKDEELGFNYLLMRPVDPAEIVQGFPEKPELEQPRSPVFSTRPRHRGGGPCPSRGQ